MKYLIVDVIKVEGLTDFSIKLINSFFSVIQKKDGKERKKNKTNNVHGYSVKCREKLEFDINQIHFSSVFTYIFVGTITLCEKMLPLSV